MKIDIQTKFNNEAKDTINIDYLNKKDYQTVEDIIKSSPYTIFEPGSGLWINLTSEKTVSTNEETYRNIQIEMKYGSKDSTSTHIRGETFEDQTEFIQTLFKTVSSFEQKYK